MTPAGSTREKGLHVRSTCLVKRRFFFKGKLTRDQRTLFLKRLQPSRHFGEKHPKRRAFPIPLPRPSFGATYRDQVTY
jgi:hypothetical protein